MLIAKDDIIAQATLCLREFFYRHSIEQQVGVN
jgi:hypothetical protein